MKDWVHKPRQNFSTTFHHDRGSGNIVEEEAERTQELEDREAYYEMLSSEYIYHSHEITAAMANQTRFLKIKPLIHPTDYWGNW